MRELGIAGSHGKIVGKSLEDNKPDGILGYAIAMDERDGPVWPPVPRQDRSRELAASSPARALRYVAWVSRLASPRTVRPDGPQPLKEKTDVSIRPLGDRDGDPVWDGTDGHPHLVAVVQVGERETFGVAHRVSVEKGGLSECAGMSLEPERAGARAHRNVPCRVAPSVGQKGKVRP